jgi:hypothetical protein
MLNHANLDARTRQFMLDEINMDVQNNTLYLSPRLSEVGRRDYPDLLREAARLHNDLWLENELRRNGRLNATEQRRKQKGGYTIAAVPITAPETLAEGEFNRFYARALCRVAIQNGIPDLVIYRAKEVKNPRAESVQLIGTTINTQSLLADLRTHQGMDTALRLPPGPNSGLSVCLPGSTPLVAAESESQ